MDIRELSSISDIILTGMAEKPDADMIIYGDEHITWSEMRDRSGQVANALRADGVGPTDRIAYIDKNGPEYFELAFGCSFINAVTVAVNWRLAPPEMAYIVNDSKAAVLVIHEDLVEHLAAFEADLESVRRIVVIGSHETHISYDEWRNAHPVESDVHDAQPDDVSMQLYTSGTTGMPKGAQLTNSNFNAAFNNVDWEMTGDARTMVMMPLFHIGGSGWAFFGMGSGATSILVREFDPVAGLQLIESEQISHAFFVPAVLAFFSMVPSDGIDLSSMQTIAYGASPITEDVLVNSMKMFGCEYSQVYGLTETTGVVTQLLPEDHDPGGPRQNLLRSAGKPIAGTEIHIIDPDTGDRLPDGEVGEVWIRSGQIMSGYWQMPEESAKALPGDGWFRSGDAAYMEDGYLFIYDRVKDMIISGGENIASSEVERVIYDLPEVREVAVIGLRDARWGERPVAIVVLAEGAGLDLPVLTEHCRARLASFKVPKQLVIRDSLPRNPSGKILKRVLRAELETSE